MIKGCDASNRQLTSTIFNVSEFLQLNENTWCSNWGEAPNLKSTIIENYLSVGIKSQAMNRTKIKSIEILK